jgi:hypothetical protein
MKQFNLETQAWEEMEEEAALNALAYLQSIYRNLSEPDGRRMRAAAIAIQYESPKLAVTGIIASDSFSERLERAIERRQGSPLLLEARAETSDE